MQEYIHIDYLIEYTIVRQEIKQLGREKDNKLGSVPTTQSTCISHVQHDCLIGYLCVRHCERSVLGAHHSKRIVSTRKYYWGVRTQYAIRYAHT